MIATRKIKSVTVVVAAYNEQGNILWLLKDILSQTSLPIKDYLITSIIVASDCSSDDTEKNVENYARQKDVRVKLLRNKSRRGKMITLLDVFKNIDTDAVISFDADIRLEENCILNLLSNWDMDNYDLVGGNPIPQLSAHYWLSLSESASYFSWCLLREIKTIKPNSIFSAHGRILGLTQRLYKNLESYRNIKSGTDRAMYLASRGKFKYIPTAKIFYKCPKSVQDYFRQMKRYENAKVSSSDFPESLSFNEIFLVFFSAFLTAPYPAFCWLILRFCLFFRYKSTEPQHALWESVSTTK